MENNQIKNLMSDAPPTTRDPVARRFADFLRGEMNDLKTAIAEDADPEGRDHWPNGRWPMVHNLARCIDALEAMQNV